MGCHALLQGIFPTQVTCIASKLFIVWATRETLYNWVSPFPNSQPIVKSLSSGASLCTLDLKITWVQAWIEIQSVMDAHNWDGRVFKGLDLRSSGHVPAGVWTPPTPGRASFGGFPGGSDGKESAVQETWIQSLGWEDPLEKGMETHSTILAWRIPRTWEPSWPTVHQVVKNHNNWYDNNRYYHNNVMLSLFHVFCDRCYYLQASNKEDQDTNYKEHSGQTEVTHSMKLLQTQ